MLASASVVDISALTADGEYRAINRANVTDFTGRPVAELSLAPAPLISRALSRMRGSTPLSRTERDAALTLAGEIFASETIDGLTFTEYAQAVSDISGMGISTVTAAVEYISVACSSASSNAYAAEPAGARQDGSTGRAAWVRRGETLAVLAAGNHPAVHVHWLEALALGYRVAVRPSRREPLTPHRLIVALRRAGFHDEHVTLLPTEHDGADQLVRSADFAIVYGGDDVVEKYRDDPRVFTQGPGRSKILLTAGANWREHLDVIVNGVAGNGGVGCTNTTAILVEGDPNQLAEAIAAELAKLPALPPSDPGAHLPVVEDSVADRIDAHVREVAGEIPIHRREGASVIPVFSGGAVVAPAVLVCDSPADPRLQVEMPFPCVWIAPWSSADGLDVLGSTLALTLVTEDAELIQQAIERPEINNVYAGWYSTSWSGGGVPHDGYLGDFLMRSKGFVSNSHPSVAEA